MKALLIGLALMALAMPATAGESCTWVGTYWVCNSTPSYGYTGTSSCSWVGTYWVCN